ncbi:MAG: hypothetical protein QXU98_04310 [Candidatus Parvarchaeota archaeon]
MRYPIKAYRLLHLLKHAREYTEFGKIMRGISTESSNNLPVGTFLSRTAPN